METLRFQILNHKLFIEQKDFVMKAHGMKDMNFSLRALLLVMLKNYIVIFNTTNYKIEATLIEPKRNILASQLPCAVFFF